MNTVLDLISTMNNSYRRAFDTPEPTERHKVYPEYKAQREAMPEDLSTAMPYLDRLSIVEYSRLEISRI